jgi:hypothetical protein
MVRGGAAIGHPFLATFGIEQCSPVQGDRDGGVGASAEGRRERPALALCFQSWGRSMSVAIEGFVGASRRKVAIRRDQEDYVIVLQPEDLVVFGNHNASALLKACNFLRKLSPTPFQSTIAVVPINRFWLRLAGQQ